MLATIICPGCEAPLRVELVEGYACGECSYCGEPVEVQDGEVYDRHADHFEEVEWPW